MEKELIFSENPEVDIWINIKQYASHIRIKQVLEKNGFSVEDALINAISGSISQALEYFEASKTVSLQTAPLLVYYGTTNLFYGFSCLLKGEKINVTNGHGLGIFNKDSSDIFDISAKIGKRNGGFSLYLKSLTNTDSNPNDNWSIRELLSSIPEVQSEFIKIFGEEKSSIIYLEEVLEEGFGSTFFVKSKLDNELIMDKLREIKNFDEYFITPNFSGSKIRLNKRLDKNQAIIESTYSNEKYLVSLKNKSQIDNFFKYFTRGAS
ncbi:YaaC family protein [Streptococcus dysgalactiae]|uniref:YaaC family protein n=1 Tax=Streptococcus dysgalactiae TaxID=1334 RepID=UPI0013FD658D|nr:YaaC family protein [Streptococcus dysgalactiae]